MKTVEDLKSVQTEAILRLNCPGFGGSALLSCGQARPLTEYKVIIVNPISIVHLFEEDAALIRQIDIALADGLTSYKLSDDKVVDRIGQQIEARSPELFQFLAEGGLLIYYLCRPFIINSESRSMDNYAWLCGLAPDQSGESTMSEQTIRHMSTVAHGRNIDKSAAANESEFEKYLDQMGLEWNTIIRTDFLTNGYSPLAQAGPKKCIAGELIAGDNGGRVVFLPAPYSPDFDRVLIECINIWHAAKQGFESGSVEDSAASLNGEDNQEITSGQIQIPTSLGEESKDHSFIEETEQNNKQISEFDRKSDSDWHPSRVEEDRNLTKGSDMDSFPGEESAVRANLKAGNLESKFESGQTNSTEKTELDDENNHVTENEKHSEDDSASKLVINKRELSRSTSAQKNIEEETIGDDAAAEVKMPRIIEGISEEATMSDWCKSYWLPGMDGLFKEIQVIRKQITELERKLATSEDMVSSLEEVKSTLLSGQPGDLLTSCKIVLDDLGFDTEVNGNNELVLAEKEQHLAVVRVALSVGSPERSELARLTESLINFWDSHGIEPKGILIACTYCETPITQRKEADFSNIILDFATKKNICLISTMQLISIYLDMKLGKLDAAKVRGEILSTAGALKGFAL